MRIHTELFNILFHKYACDFTVVAFERKTYDYTPTKMILENTPKCPLRGGHKTHPPPLISDIHGGHFFIFGGIVILCLKNQFMWTNILKQPPQKLYHF